MNGTVILGVLLGLLGTALIILGVSRLRKRALIGAGVLFIIIGLASVLLSVLFLDKTGKGAATSGYQTYSKYGFSFKYPKGMSFVEHGLLADMADEKSGTITATGGGKGFKVLTISWTSVGQAPALEDIFDSVYKNILNYKGVTRVRRTSQLYLGEIRVSGHPVMAQAGVTKIDAVEVDEVIGIWYCDISKRVFQLSVESSEISELLNTERLRSFQGYLKSFSDH